PKDRRSRGIFSRTEACRSNNRSHRIFRRGAERNERPDMERSLAARPKERANASASETRRSDKIYQFCGRLFSIARTVRAKRERPPPRGPTKNQKSGKGKRFST